MITIFSFDHMAGENQEYMASDTCVFRMGERKAFKWRKQSPLVILKHNCTKQIQVIS